MDSHDPKCLFVVYVLICFCNMHDDLSGMSVEPTTCVRLNRLKKSKSLTGKLSRTLRRRFLRLYIYSQSTDLLYFLIESHSKSCSYAQNCRTKAILARTVSKLEKFDMPGFFFSPLQNFFCSPRSSIQNSNSFERLVRKTQILHCMTKKTLLRIVTVD